MIWRDKNIEFEVDEKEVNYIYDNPNEFSNIAKKLFDDANNIRYTDSISDDNVIYFEKKVTLSKREFKKIYPSNIITLDIKLADTILVKNDVLTYDIPWSIRRFLYGGGGAVGTNSLSEIRELLEYKKFIELISTKKIVQQYIVPLNTVSNKELLTEDEQNIILKYFNNGSTAFINLALDLIYKKDIQENEHILMTILAKTSELYRINTCVKGKRFLVKFKGKYPGLRI